MKTIPHYSIEVFSLNWFGKIQLVTTERDKIITFIKNAVNTCNCKAEQFTIASNYCTNYNVNEFLTSKT